MGEERPRNRKKLMTSKSVSFFWWKHVLMVWYIFFHAYRIHHLRWWVLRLQRGDLNHSPNTFPVFELGLHPNYQGSWTFTRVCTTVNIHKSNLLVVNKGQSDRKRRTTICRLRLMYISAWGGELTALQRPLVGRQGSRGLADPPPKNTTRLSARQASARAIKHTAPISQSTLSRNLITVSDFNRILDLDTPTELTTRKTDRKGGKKLLVVCVSASTLLTVCQINIVYQHRSAVAVVLYDSRSYCWLPVAVLSWNRLQTGAM